MFKYKRKHFILVKSGNQNKLTNTPHKLKWAEPPVAQIEIIKLTERPGQQAALFTIGRQILTGSTRPLSHSQRNQTPPWRLPVTAAASWALDKRPHQQLSMSCSVKQGGWVVLSTSPPPTLWIRLNLLWENHHLKTVLWNTSGKYPQAD